MAKPFDPVYPDWWIEMEFSGAGNGWTNVSRDVRIAEPVRWNWGIQGTSPTDRVASTGTLTFALDNSEANANAQVGWYAPDSAFARAGFDLGIGVRIAWSHGGAVRYKKYYLEDIAVVPGVNGQRVTLCQCVDLMDTYARHHLQTVGIQVGKRSDQVVDAIVADVTQQPANQSIATGQDTYAYALDTMRAETPVALSAFQQVAQSELGQIYVSADATDGETLVFEDRHKRVTVTANSFSFREDEDHLSVIRSRRELRNVIRVITHARRVDAAATTVLFQLADAEPQVDAGQTITLFGPYRDPTQEAARVGGTEMVTPVATTDYTMDDGASPATDLTGDFTVVATFGAQGVQFQITNNSTVTGYITKLQCRGKGVYDFENAIMEASDATSRTDYGDRVYVLDLPYQNDVNVGQGIADYLLGVYKSPMTFVTEISYIANRHTDLMEQAVLRDISDRIGVTETVTGVEEAITGSDVKEGWFINAVSMEIVNGEILRVTYTLSPASIQAYWVLGTSVLDETTVLAFV